MIAFYTKPYAQVVAIFDYIKYDHRSKSMIEGIKTRDFEKFAEGYNGGGKLAETYGKSIKKFYNIFIDIVKNVTVK